MSIENLDKIFQPNSIAVVGASEREGSVGAALMRNLIEHGFSGDIFPINPKHNKLWGKSTCPSITDLRTAVDLAIIASPIMSAPQIVKECAAASVGGGMYPWGVYPPAIKNYQLALKCDLLSFLNLVCD